MWTPSFICNVPFTRRRSPWRRRAPGRTPERPRTLCDHARTRRSTTSAWPSTACRCARARRCSRASAPTRSSSAPTATAPAACARCSPPTATAAARAFVSFAHAWDRFARRQARAPGDRRASCACWTAQLEASILGGGGPRRARSPTTSDRPRPPGARGAPDRPRLAGRARATQADAERALARGRAAPPARQALKAPSVPGRMNWISGMMQRGRDLQQQPDGLGDVLAA